MPIKLINNDYFYVDDKINCIINKEIINKLIEKDNKGKSFFLIKRKKVYVDIIKDAIKIFENFIFVKDTNIYFKLNDNSIIIINGKINNNVIIEEFEGRKQKKNVNSDKFQVYNQYFLVKNEHGEEFYMMYTSADIFFSFSKEDRELIVNYGIWSYIEQSNRIQSQNKPLYNLFTEKYIIYKNGNRLDYRRENLIETENKGELIKEAKKKKIPQEILTELQIDTLPENVFYTREALGILNDEQKYIEYFYVKNEPTFISKLNLYYWETPKSLTMTITEKYNFLLKKFDEITNNVVINDSYLVNLLNNKPTGIYYKFEKNRNRFYIDKEYTPNKITINSTSSNDFNEKIKFCQILREYEKLNLGEFNWQEILNSLTIDEKYMLETLTTETKTLDRLNTSYLPDNCYFVNGNKEKYFEIKSINWKSSSYSINVNLTWKINEFINKYKEINPNDMNIQIIELEELIKPYSF